jgi:ubiquitin C-terminal hydrolase
MPPPSQGQRALAALQHQQKQDGSRSSGSMAPVAAAESSRGSSKLRQPSLSSMDALEDDVDYGFDRVVVPQTSTATVSRAECVGSPTQSTGRPRASRQSAGSPLLDLSSTPKPPLSSYPKQMPLSAADVVRAGTALAKEENLHMSPYSTARKDQRRVFVPTGDDHLNSHSPQQRGLSAVKSNAPQHHAAAPTISTVPPRQVTMSSLSPKLKAIDNSFITSPRPVPAVPPSTHAPLDSRFVSMYQQPLPQVQGTYGHFDNGSPRAPIRSPPPPVVPIAPLVSLYRDHSGFRNAGNTCYAASVLTALLRQTLFVSELNTFVAEYGDLKTTREYSTEEEYEEVVEQTPASEGDDESLRQGLFDERISPEKDENERVFHDFFSTTTTAGSPAKEEEAPAPRQVVVKTRTVITRERDYLCVLHRALQDAAKRLKTPSHISGGVGVEKIAAAMAWYEDYDTFFDGDQHDAHEFYVGLVSCIEQEAIAAMKKAERAQRKKRLKMMKRLRSDPEDDSAPSQNIELEDTSVVPGDVWINKLLRGMMHVVISCRRRGCGKMQHTREPFVNIALPMSVPSTPLPNSLLYELDLQSIPDTETLVAASLAPDALDSYKCDGCHQSVLQYHGGCIDAAPPMLVVQWKRFNASFVNGEYNVRKNTSQVQVSHEFTVVSRPEHLLTKCGGCAAASDGGAATSDDRRVRRTTYVLKAVVLHQGATLHAGHYITLFQGQVTHDTIDDEDILQLSGKEPSRRVPDESTADARHDGTWLRANDTEVSELLPAQVQLAMDKSRACYLAIYEAKGSVFEMDSMDDVGKRSWRIEFPPMQDDPATVQSPDNATLMDLPTTLPDTLAATPPCSLSVDPETTATADTVVGWQSDDVIGATCPTDDCVTPPPERCASEEFWFLSPTK